MKLELGKAELQIIITALRVLRSQQQSLATIIGSLDPVQAERGMRMVTDLETKLVAAKKEAL